MFPISFVAAVAVGLPPFVPEFDFSTLPPNGFPGAFTYTIVLETESGQVTTYPCWSARGTGEREQRDGVYHSFQRSWLMKRWGATLIMAEQVVPARSPVRKAMVVADGPAPYLRWVPRPKDLKHPPSEEAIEGTVRFDFSVCPGGDYVLTVKVWSGDKELGTSEVLVTPEMVGVDIKERVEIVLTKAGVYVESDDPHKLTIGGAAKMRATKITIDTKAIDAKPVAGILIPPPAPRPDYFMNKVDVVENGVLHR